MKKLDIKICESLRHQIDPFADRVIDEFFKSEESKKEALGLLGSLSKNTDRPGKNAPQVFQDYFKEESQLPDWVDWSKVEVGQKLFMTYTPQVLMLLMCSSLPHCYACRKGAKVMAMTGRFGADDISVFKKRMVETAQFVVNVMAPKGLEPEGRGITTSLIVRLMHASVRYYIMKDDWDEEEYGLPINQEDELGTLMAFSVIVLRGLRNLGIDLTDEEAEGYYHCWRIVGKLVGIQESIIPENLAEAEEVTDLIFTHQFEFSPDGAKLTKACVHFIEEVIPGKAMDQIPISLMRFFIGEEMADGLDVPKVESKVVKKMVPTIVKIINREMDDLYDDFSIFSIISTRFNSLFLEGMLKYFNDNRKVEFHLPTSLRGNWNV